MLDRDGRGAATLDRPDTETVRPEGGVPRDRFAGTSPGRRDLVVAGLVGVTVMVVAAGMIWRTPVVPTDPWHYVSVPRSSSPATGPGYRWATPATSIILADAPRPSGFFKNSQASYYFWPLALGGESSPSSST